MPDIQNEQALTHIFGSWPSFHDAEILSILLDRSGKDGPSLTAKIHLWETTGEVDTKGHYILKNQTIVTLRFGHILLDSLNGFNKQNVLWDLEISDIDPNTKENDGRQYEVFMPTSYGCEASFKCQSIAVVQVEPYQAST